MGVEEELGENYNGDLDLMGIDSERTFVFFLCGSIDLTVAHSGMGIGPTLLLLSLSS